jgi:hypothetical protein
MDGTTHSVWETRSAAAILRVLVAGSSEMSSSMHSSSSGVRTVLRRPWSAVADANVPLSLRRWLMLENVFLSGTRRLGKASLYKYCACNVLP